MKNLMISILAIALLLTACSSLENPNIQEDETVAENPVNKENEALAQEIENIKYSAVPPVQMYINGVEVSDAIIASHNEGVTLYDSVESLLWRAQDASGLVVIGEFIHEADLGFNYHYDPYLEKDIIVGGNAYGQLLVTDVLYGDVEVGETITIWQQYSFDEEYKELIMFTDSTPMHKGDRWIYFLVSDGKSKVYESIGLHQGRFPIPNQEMADVAKICLREFNKIQEWLKDKKIDMTVTEAFEKGLLSGLRDENGGSYLPHTGTGEVFYLNAEENDEYDRMWMEVVAVKEKVTKNVETSALGVFQRENFNFFLYAVILDYFKIEAQDWVNPGRGYDAGLIAIREDKGLEINGVH